MKSFKKNWRELKIGDVVVVELLDRFIVGIGMTDAGEKREWKVKEKYWYGSNKDNYSFILEGGGNRIIANDDLCGDDDIRTQEPNLSLPLGLKCKFYIKEKQDYPWYRRLFL